MTATTKKAGELLPVDELEALAERYALATLSSQGRFQRALVLAEGMEKLRAALGPYVPRVLPLMNQPLGFLTDKKDGYSVEVVRDCLIEAALRGVYPVGNEFNIIASRCYITRNGYARLVRELPGLTDLRLSLRVPVMKNAGAVVPCSATWRLNGTGDHLAREIPVRINTGMGADAILGKATRKLLKAVYEQVTGSEHTPEDAEVGEDAALIGRAADLSGPDPGRSRTGQVLERLQNGGAAVEVGKVSRLAQIRRLDELCRSLEMGSDEVYGLLGADVGVDLTDEQVDRAVVLLMGRLAEREA